MTTLTVLSETTIRRAVLLASVQALIGADEHVEDAAYLWKRHRLMIPYSIAAFAVVAWAAAWAGWDDWPTRIAIGAVGAAVAVMSTTEYRVLAKTSEGLIMFKASRIRQVAKSLEERIGRGQSIEPVGGTMLASEWQVGRDVYTVPKASEKAMEAISRR